jgi:hypothetical protein
MEHDTTLSRRGFLTVAAATAASAATGLAGCSNPSSSGRKRTRSSSGGHTGTSSQQAQEPRFVPLAEPPAAPPYYRSFVSRPDLKPTAVSVSGSKQYAAMSGAPRYVFLSLLTLGPTLPGGAQAGPMIIDARGDLVWFQPTPHPNVFNFTPQTYRGKPVVSWWSGTNLATYGEGSYTLLDESYSTVATVAGADGLQGDLHDFLITPEDTALFTAYEQTTVNGMAVEEGIAFEVDIASGDVVYSWRSLDPGHVGVPETYLPRPQSGPWDYFHINSVSLWPGPERDLLISARNTCAVYRVSRSDGAIVWRLGGRRSDFEMTDRTRFWWQHDARALQDGSGVSLFDDASLPVERSQGDPQSRGIVLKFGPGKREVTLEVECLHSDTEVAGNEAGYMGNMQLLSNGSYFVGWGGQIPYFSAFGPKGSGARPPLLLDGRFPVKCFSYRAYASDWVGKPPQSELAVAARPAASGASDAWEAYASWNGATEVASWKVSAGTSPGRLSNEHVVARNGFETAIPMTVPGSSGSTPPFFQAQALDHNGKVLGVSKVVPAQSS